MLSELQYSLHQNEEALSKLRTFCMRAISNAEALYNQQVREWDEIDRYLKGLQQPVGWQGNEKAALVAANDPSNPDAEIKSYVVINKVFELEERKLADFIGGKKTIKARGLTWKDRKWASVLSRVIDSVLRSNQFSNRVMFPAIDNAMKKGIWHIEVNYNPLANLPVGQIEINPVSCRDVMLDPNAVQPFYEDERVIIQLKRYDREAANKLFGPYLKSLGKTEFTPDRKYAERRKSDRSIYQDADFVTIYRLQIREDETLYYDVQDSGELRVVDAAEASALAEENPDRLMVEVLPRWYNVLYNEAVGVFSVGRIIYDEPTIKHLLNIRLEDRVYPYPNFVFYKNLQDLLNVIATILVRNIKEEGKKIIGVDPQVFAMPQLRDAIQKVLEEGEGVIPTVNMANLSQSTFSQGLMALFGLVANAINDIAFQNPLTRGQLPVKQIASRTVQTLIARDLATHGRMDIMIDMCMTSVARLVAKMIARHFTFEDWIEYTGARPGDPNYIPINMKLTPQEYLALIAELYKIPPIAQGETEERYQLAVLQAMKVFEEDNFVERLEVPLYMVSGVPGLSPEKTLDEAEYKALVAASLMSEEDFAERYGVTKIMTQVISINDLSKSPELRIEMHADFNYERNKDYITNQAVLYANYGWITGLRAMEAAEFPDAERLWNEAVAQNQALSIGKMIVSNPTLYQAVQQLLAQVQAGQLQPQ